MAIVFTERQKELFSQIKQINIKIKHMEEARDDARLSYMDANGMSGQEFTNLYLEWQTSQQDK